jgi:hypothetical protein
VTDTPWATLRALIDSGSSGELIVASDAIEIHVYLLDGKLAWATSSTARNEFLRRLVDDHGISSDLLRDVIEDCRKTRARLGETLIAWGVTSALQIRDALRGQIEEALVAAAANPGARCLFLPRRLEYAPELTFAISDLHMEAATAVGSSEIAQKIVTTVLEGVADAVWVEVIEQGAIAARAVRGPVRPTAVVEQLHGMLDGEAVEALTLRSSVNGAVLAQRVPGMSATVWCAVGGGAKLGVASAVLINAVGARPLPPTADASEQAWQKTSDPGARFGVKLFAEATVSRDELLAAFALDATGGPTGVWRGSVGLDVHTSWARRLAPMLTTAIRDTFSRADGSLLYDHVALRAVIGNLVYYGTLLPDSTTAVWLVLGTWATQGLGWALLQAVARQVRGEA